MQAMIADGVHGRPAVDCALGFHNHPDMPVGTFGFVRGACLAAADRFDITVRGRSGHAAYPHTTVDPIVAAASLVTAIADRGLARGAADRPGRGDRGRDPGRHDANIIPDA